MVTRDRRFPTPDGYSRRAEKRDVMRLVEEGLEAGLELAPPRRIGGGEVQSASRFELELLPRVPVRSGLDLRAIERQRPRRARSAPPAARERPENPFQPLLQLLQLLQRWGQPLWQRFCRWASWH